MDTSIVLSLMVDGSRGASYIDKLDVVDQDGQCESHGIMGRILRGSIVSFNNMHRVVQASNIYIYTYMYT